MKKTISVLLSVLMLALLMVPAVSAAGAHTVTFTPPTGTLNNYGVTDPLFTFVKSNNGRMEFVEDPNGIYYLANDGYYYTADRIMFDPDDTSPRTTYSPKAYEGTISVEDGETVSFKVITNKVYNGATVSLSVNGSAIYPDDMGEYKILADRDLTITVNESALMRNHFSVKLTSGEGYSVKNIKGESAHFALYGDDFKFRVRIGSGYSDADLKVVLIRGGNELAEFVDGEDLDSARAFIGYGTETLVSDGVDSDGCRTYTIKNVTTDCKIVVSGVRTQKKADILTYLKRILKMILDALHIDSSFLGIVDMVAYRDVHFDDTAFNGIDADYMLLSGVFDEFKPTMNDDAGRGYFTVMNGESVTIRISTKDKSLTSHLGAKWKVGDRDEVTVYGNTWTASYDVSTGYVYYSTTISVDNINGETFITLVK